MNAVQRQVEQLARFQKWVKEQGGTEHPQRLSTFATPQQKERLAWIAEQVEPFLSPRLEIGCNIGYVMAHTGVDTGVDIQPEVIMLAKVLSPEKTFYVDDARNLHLPSSYFGVVTMPDVLEHMPLSDVPQAIREARRVTKGPLVVTVPNGDLDTEEAHNFKHQFLPTMAILRDLFGKSAMITTIGVFYGVTEGF